MQNTPISFENSLGKIDKEIEKYRSKWNLGFLTHFDFDDVAQLIRIHISKKWETWDQTRALEPWCNAIISNQIKNLRRNNYASFAQPCVRCPFSQGDDMCAITTSGLQCSECPLFSKWEKKKKIAYDVKVPISMESSGHAMEEVAYEGPNFDLSESVAKLSAEIEKRTTPKMFKVFKMLYIDQSTDIEIANFMGYKTTEKNRTAGYKQIRNLKKKFLELAKIILQETDILT